LFLGRRVGLWVRLTLAISCEGRHDLALVHDDLVADDDAPTRHQPPLVSCIALLGGAVHLRETIARRPVTFANVCRGQYRMPCSLQIALQVLQKAPDLLNIARKGEVPCTRRLAFGSWHRIAPGFHEVAQALEQDLLARRD